jgi:RNA polymerase sigma-70 factor (ECF subfamily)
MALPSAEPELVRVAARCSREAFEALLERHRFRLRLLARRFATAADDQEDLVQDVTVRLLDHKKRALCAWQPYASFAAYVTTIAYRQGLEFAERKARLPGEFPKALPDGGDVAEDGRLARELGLVDETDPQQEVLASERSATLHDAVEQLSDSDQLLIRLRFFEQLEAPSIAKVMGISHGAARKRVFDALRRLRRLIEPHSGLFAPDPPH